MDSNSERFTFSLSASRACSRSVCAGRKSKRSRSTFKLTSAERTGSASRGRSPTHLFLSISAFSLHGLHQLHQSVHEGQLGGQQRPHDPHALVALEGTGGVVLKWGGTDQQEDLFVVRQAPPPLVLTFSKAWLNRIMTFRYI